MKNQILPVLLTCMLFLCGCNSEENITAPSLSNVPFNLICGTDTIKEYRGKVGEHIIVEVDYIPADMTVEWRTDNPEVATIEPSRLGTQCIIFIEGAGNVTVTATRGDETRTVEVIGTENSDSNSPITSAQVKYSGTSLIEFSEAVGNSINLTLHYDPANIPVTEEDVRWHSETVLLQLYKVTPKVAPLPAKE